MSQSKADRLAAVHERAMREFRAIWIATADEREQCLADRRFATIAGAQWEGSLGEQFENLPKFEVNKIALALIRIFNEYRNNRITVDFRPKDEASSDELADTLDGLYRADEQDSGAQEAYDNAFDEGVTGGFGAWRVRADYEDEEDEEDDRQRIRIEPIYDADRSVFFNLDAKRQDKADATRCFVLTSMTREAYEDQYPDNGIPGSFPDMTETWGAFDWVRADLVYVAEYYEVEHETTVVHVFRGLTGDEERVRDEDLTPEKEFMLKATGYTESRQRKVKRRRVHKYLLTGLEVIGDKEVLAGPNIPIVPFFGKRWFIENIERCQGHVRTSKDAQRLKNMQTSRLAQIAAMTPIEKPIVTPGQMYGHAQQWADDNIKQFPYLLLNPVTDKDGNEVPAGPIGYTKPPSIPPAMGALLQLTSQDMQELLGSQQAGEELHANVSAKAVELVQNKLDMQTFIYMDNMAKAMKRSGEIWRGMACEAYVEEGRRMKTVTPQGEPEFVELMRPVVDPKTAKVVHENDLSAGKFDVVVDVGPSFVSRRDATVRALTGMMQITGAVDPETTQVLAATALMNMEGEGIGDLRDFFRARLVRKGVVKPTDDEKEQLAQEQATAQPDPQAQYLRSAAAAEEAKAVKARADTIATLAGADLDQAKTAGELAKIGDMQHQQVLDAARTVYDVSQPPSQPAQAAPPV